MENKGDTKDTEYNWQAELSLADCKMLVNEIACDVKFLVGRKSAELSAHKYVLGSKSSVMFAMFYGPMAETHGVIRVPDIEPSIFEEFLRYLYTDKVILTGENVCQLMYTANKYYVGRLFSVCGEFIEEKVDAYNVCAIAENIRLFGSDKLLNICKKIIVGNIIDIFRRKSFIHLSSNFLESILSDDNLEVQEYAIFDAVLMWAENQCKKQNLSLSGHSKRQVMGHLLFLVRFPLMNTHEFRIAADSGVLTLQEQTSIFKYITEGGDCCFTFSCKARQKTEYVCLRNTQCKNEVKGYATDTEKVRLNATKNITLIGILISIPLDDQIRCAVTANIHEVNGYQGTSVTQCISTKDLDSNNCLKIYLQQPVILSQGSDYNVSMTFQHVLHSLDVNSRQQNNQKNRRNNELCQSNLKVDSIKCRGIEFTFTEQSNSLFDCQSYYQIILSGLIFRS